MQPPPTKQCPYAACSSGQDGQAADVGVARPESLEGQCPYDAPARGKQAAVSDDALRPVTHAAGSPLLIHSLSAPELSGARGSAAVTSSSHRHPHIPASVPRAPKREGTSLLSRRELRRCNRTFTLAELAEHKYVDDAWIAVDGEVYDITDYLLYHEGWREQWGAATTVLSILAHVGQDVTQEFHQIHRTFPVAYRRLAAFYIGDLALGPGKSENRYGRM